jgi:hypothetical protein
MTPNIITGETPLNKCIDMRSAYGGCGYDGKLFEAKQAQPADTKRPDKTAAGSMTAEQIMAGSIVVTGGRGAGYPVEIRKSLAERIAYWWHWWFD